jgi:hypothetical protein
MRRPALTEVLGSLPEASEALVRAVLEQADAHGVCVHLVGGPVRDLLLGRAVHDVDLLVEAWDGGGALELARAVTTPELQATAHDRFGTITLRGEKATIDLATVRREAYAHDGALPTVEPGSLEEDLRRRDFTVNAWRCRSRRRPAPAARESSTWRKASRTWSSGGCASCIRAASTMIRRGRCAPRVSRHAWASASRATPARRCATPCATAPSGA